MTQSTLMSVRASWGDGGKTVCWNDGHRGGQRWFAHGVEGGKYICQKCMPENAQVSKYPYAHLTPWSENGGTMCGEVRHKGGPTWLAEGSTAGPKYVCRRCFPEDFTNLPERQVRYVSHKAR